MPNHDFIVQILETSALTELHNILQANQSRLTHSLFQEMKDKFILKERSNNTQQQQKFVAILTASLDYVTDEVVLGMLYWAKGLAEAFSGDLESAIQTTETAVPLQLSQNNLEAYALLVTNLSGFYLHLDDQLHKIASLASKAIEQLKVHNPQSVAIGKLYWNWGLAQKYLKQMTEAIRLMQQAESFIDQFSEPEQAYFLDDFGEILTQAGGYLEALARFETSHSYYEVNKENEPHDWAIHTQQMAGIYQKIGQLGDALQMSDEAIVGHSQTGDKIDLLYVKIRHAEILLDIGQYERIVGSYNRKTNQRENSLFANEPLHQLKPRERIEPHLIQGLAFSYLNEWVSAEQELNQAYQYAQIVNPQWQKLVQLVLARLYLIWADEIPSKAQLAITILEELSLQTGLSTIRQVELHLLFAEAYLHLDNKQQAQQFLAKIEPSSLTTTSFKAQYHFLWGQWHRLSENWLVAKEHYSQALTVSLYQQQQIYLESFQATVFVQREKLFQQLLNCCLHIQDWSAIWNYGETHRAYSLIRSMHTETQVEDSQKQKLYTQRVLRFQLANQLFTEELSLVQEAEIRQQLQQADSNLRDLVSHAIVSEETLFTETVPPEVISQTLLPNTLLLTYTCIQDQIWVIAVDNTGITHNVALPYKREEITEAIIEFTQIGFSEWVFDIEWYGEKSIKDDFGHYLTEAKKRLQLLYKMLWEPLNIHHEQVVVVADEILRNLSFSALFDGTTYLVDKHIISYAPSASIYHLCQQRAHQRIWGDETLLLGYEGHKKNLHYVKDEVDYLAKRYPHPYILTDKKANLENLLSHAPSSWLLHLATHGYMIDNNPFQSYLELPYAPNLRLYDAAQLDLSHTDLVVLSACESGRVQQKGNELLGLLWGFMQAGAYTLVVNQWKVVDLASYELMKAFYNQYEQGHDKAKALQQAQITLRDDHSQWYFAHPYTWASFLVYGYAQPISKPVSNSL